MFGPVYTSQTIAEPFRSIRQAYVQRVSALVDSLGTSTHYVHDTQRIIDILARQLGDTFAALGAEQRTSAVDTAARTWIRERRAERDTAPASISPTSSSTCAPSEIRKGDMSYVTNAMTRY